MELHELKDLAEKLDRLRDPQQRDRASLVELVKDCTGSELDWLAREFERRAWKENDVAFALRRLRIDRK